MALIVGVMINEIKWKWLKVLVLLVIIFEGTLNQQNEFRIKESECYKLDVESIADQVSKPNDLIAINASNGNPQDLYFTHRKGWVRNEKTLTSNWFQNEIREKGGKFIFINRNYWTGEYDMNLELLFENDNYWVFKL